MVNDWYITAYEPIYSGKELVGILYVGNPEKDLQKLREILHNLKIGKSGYPYAFDKYGTLVIHPANEGQDWQEETR